LGNAGESDRQGGARERVRVRWPVDTTMGATWERERECVCEREREREKTTGHTPSTLPTRARILARACSLYLFLSLFLSL